MILPALSWRALYPSARLSLIFSINSKAEVQVLLVSSGCFDSILMRSEVDTSRRSYEDGGYRRSDLAKVCKPAVRYFTSKAQFLIGKMMFLLNSKPVDALALIVHRSAQDRVGRAWVKKLRKWHPDYGFLADLMAHIFRQGHTSTTIRGPHSSCHRS